jgi:hypothetical protein
MVYSASVLMVRRIFGVDLILLDGVLLRQWTVENKASKLG